MYTCIYVSLSLYIDTYITITYTCWLAELVHDDTQLNGWWTDGHHMIHGILEAPREFPAEWWPLSRWRLDAFCLPVGVLNLAISRFCISIWFWRNVWIFLSSHTYQHFCFLLRSMSWSCRTCRVHILSEGDWVYEFGLIMLDGLTWLSGLAIFLFSWNQHEGSWKIEVPPDHPCL